MRGEDDTLPAHSKDFSPGRAEEAHNAIPGRSRATRIDHGKEEQVCDEGAQQFPILRQVEPTGQAKTFFAGRQPSAGSGAARHPDGTSSTRVRERICGPTWAG